jgi:hypothetical protein
MIRRHPDAIHADRVLNTLVDQARVFDPGVTVPDPVHDAHLIQPNPTARGQHERVPDDAVLGQLAAI